MRYRSLSQWEKVALATVFAAAAAVKMWTVLVYAPATLGDNSAFIQAADQMLSGTRWLHDAGLSEAVRPPTLWRPIGYSLLIAAAKIGFGDSWPYAITGIQAMLSLGAGLLLVNLCLAAGVGGFVSAAVFGVYQTSVPLSTDALIMEDALTGALGTTALWVILRPVVAGRIPGPTSFLITGILAGLSFLVRDVYHFVMPVVGAATFVLLIRKTGVFRAIAGGVALAGPVFAVALALQLWNEHRTGHPVTTTAGQTAYLYGLLRAAEHDPAVIEGTSKIEEVLRATNKTFDYVDTVRATDALFSREGMDSVAQYEAARQLFWAALIRHPEAFIAAALKRLRFVQQASLFASPLTRLDDLHWWAGGATEEGYRTGWRAEALQFARSRDSSDLTVRAVIHVGIRKACQMIGVGLLMVFLIGTPALWLLLRRHLGGAADAALMAWGVYVLWVCLYVPVSFEVRYLSPVIGPALFAVAVVLLNTTRLIHAAREVRSSAGASLRS